MTLKRPLYFYNFILYANIIKIFKKHQQHQNIPLYNYTTAVLVLGGEKWYTQPNQKLMCEVFCQPAVYPSCIPISQDQSKLPQTHLPPSTIFSPGLTSQISPPAQFQWYLPFLVQLGSCQHQAFLQI